MSYKTLQNALFKLSGGQAMPNYNGKISGVTLNNNQSVTAPVNGYFLVHAEVSDTNAINDVSVTLSNSDRITTTQGCREGNWVDFLLPIQKGMTYVFGFLNIQTARYDIFPLVGGGINRLLSLAQSWIRGGVLWLTSSNYSELGAKVCSMTKVLGQVLRRSQKSKPESLSLPRGQQERTQHLLMDISVFTRFIRRFGTFTPNRLSIKAYKQPDQFLSGSATIPAAKGSTITYRFDTAPGELWFIPTVGAQ